MMNRYISPRLILLVGAFFAFLTGCLGQTASKNYITTYIPQIVVTNEWAIPGLTKEAGQKRITYLDGLGRTDQVIQVSGSPMGFDMVTPITYDAFGRELRKFLPYTLNTANVGAYVTADSAGQKSFYTTLYGATDGSVGFSKSEFEPSSVNRLLKQGFPGSVWQPNAVAASDHSLKYDYSANTSIDSVRMWIVGANNTPVSTTFYPLNSLYKTVIYDENNNKDSGTPTKTEEYKDKQGNVVLKRAYDAGKKFSTYYVYDDMELLRFVLPPKAAFDNAVTTNELDSLCYQYRYDPQKRMIKKKMPGADSILMVYDARDRLVLTQDGILRPSSKWYFTKYDEINRPVITGCVLLTGKSADVLRTNFANYLGTQFESQLSTGNIGYSLNNSYPTNVSTSIDSTNILTVTYYDNYSHLGVSGFRAASNGTFNKFNRTISIDNTPDNDGNNNGYFDKVKGQVTGTKVKVLDNNEYTTSGKWLCRMNFYNDRYRLIQTKQTLYSGGTVGADTLTVSMLYDFTGKVIQTKQVQTFGPATTVIDKYYTFDHLARLTKSEQQITGDAANGKVVVALNGYNEIGQLIDKKLHQSGTYGYLQSVDYTYNIRGWLTGINNPDNLATLQTGDPNPDLFGERLNYVTSETGLNNTNLQYNGNIAAMVWTSKNKTKRGYAFTYDGLNRLTLGDFKGYNTAWVDSTSFEEKTLSYDLNGNLNRLVRTNSTGGTMADYIYKYKGNQLNKINSLTAYTYDPNGNATLDGVRGFTIAYNSLNLPKSITSGTDNIAYIYAADGNKLAKKKSDGTYLYYTGNMVYKNDKTLNYLLFEEGLVNKSTGGYSYEYHLKDHLGNTRISFQPNGSGTTLTQVAEYYPFGSSYLPISPAGTNKYLYNGKEKQDDLLGTGNTALDWYDYGARFYDPIVGRWPSPDPKTEKYYSISPYSYCRNNPVNRIDPDGRIDYSVNKNGDFYQTNPKMDAIKSFFGINDKNDRILMEGTNKEISKLPAGSIGKIDHNNEKSTQFEIKNSAVAEKVFKDVSRNTTVEWARVEHSTGNSKSNTLMNNHSNGSVDGAKVAIDYQNSGQSVPLMEHSHPPLDSNVPTWNMRIQVSEDGDMINAKSLPNTTQRALNVQTNQYEYYNGNGLYKKEDAGK